VAGCGKLLNALEREVLRKIYGPLLVNGQWRNGYDGEICKLYGVIVLTWNTRLRGLSCDQNDRWTSAQGITERIHSGGWGGRVGCLGVVSRGGRGC
jgi:hypothetical protein